MSAGFEWNPNELYHFGTKGMKWGQRRYQNPDGTLTSLGKERYGSGGKRGARGMTHDLNKLDRERATAQYRASRYGRKIARKDARYAEKIAKAEEAGKTRKAARLQDKRSNISSTHAAKKAKAYNELLSKNKAMTQQILGKAKAAGMNVKTKDVKRVVNKGRTVAKNVAKAGGVLGGLMLAGKNGRNIPRQIHSVADQLEARGTRVLNMPVGRVMNKHAQMITNAGIAAALATPVGIRRTKGTRYKVRKGR